MNTISAIETQYKGYRFRSRLEARWAMFFDLCGVSWTHEPQPFDVAGEAYLPDFLCSHENIEWVHEVKSLHEQDRIAPVSVYLAGKMKAEHEWRGWSSITDRSSRSGSTTSATSEAWEEARHYTTMNEVGFNMTGPFSLSCDHGCSHAPEAVHMATSCNDPYPAGVVGACTNAIACSDLLCAHLNTDDCYGTLIEIGYARGKGIPTSVTVDRQVANALTRPGHHLTDVGSHDLWFAQAIASASQIVSNVLEAQAFHASFIRANTSREFRLISAIGIRRPAALSFGDPLDVANRGSAYGWRGAPIQALCVAHRAHAEAIRSHRFDRR